MIRRLFLGALAACLLAVPLPARAGVPTDQLKGAIDRVVKTLDNPALKGESKVMERRAAVDPAGRAAQALPLLPMTSATNVRARTAMSART